MGAALLRDRVLAVLVAGLAAAALWLPFLTHAPNRLLSGRPVMLAPLLHGSALLLAVPALVLVACIVLPRRRAVAGTAAAAAAALAAGLLALAGAEAARRGAAGPSFARTSLGAGCWTMLLLAGLACTDAVGRLGPGVPGRVLLGLAAALPAGVLVATGRLDHLSIMREYAARHDAFAGAALRHVVLVAGAVVPTLALGLPLGRLLQRRPAWRGPVLGALNVVQTIPSIAMFGLLMAPLSGLAGLVPGLARAGIGGVGIAPALVALTLYALLPVVRNTLAGLEGVPPAATDAARGIGMGPAGVLWRVEVPLALPVVLAGVRVTVVQLVGLAVVAALVGAGGLGAIMFQGLFANALDLVLLGAVPVVLMALLADAALRIATALAAVPGAGPSAVP